MSFKYKVDTSNLLIYTVLDFTKSYTVDMKKKTCTCQRFQYDEMHCSRALVVLTKRHVSFYDYCFDYYKKEAFMATYKDNIPPLSDPISWEIPNEIKEIIVLPPKNRRPVGRPK
ncbi:uncharacterized protein LOC133826006 [Humulus lupulus]|uniref:uncharacterized protein LOC133826006 n=1 Tax=Humulus lupulus TaxID=3486 RepID=UPI002B40DEC5|nr:uncharacterized protein LOC133826006 [Humulus lupulus]